jgi:hypothetical protein
MRSIAGDDTETVGPTRQPTRYRYSRLGLSATECSQPLLLCMQALCRPWRRDEPAQAAGQGHTDAGQGHTQADPFQEGMVDVLTTLAVALAGVQHVRFDMYKSGGWWTAHALAPVPYCMPLAL